MLTPDELAAMREREQAATPGPWAANESQFSSHEKISDWYVAGGKGGGVVQIVGRWNQDDKADALFIAHAREDIPRLLARIDELEVDLSLAQSLGFHRRNA